MEGNNGKILNYVGDDLPESKKHLRIADDRTALLRM